ncbi:FAD-binding protein [Halococcus saccharolyticus]|uniref:FAD-dependent pyridine nucleotide-disulfide oxidoreductase n=1 Tax=Halococcus saccharolyticus DSM 5350 TaxID=1227455 RepID=M0MDJ6_9EURY|nr:FAD-binding protein [Halococcus saccharolyticus]EMA43408.1 FAD-dependent pyridine nucleotide-disulfide oxidoreductase [Halococcus saccharolyticus DSM 5350]
MTTESDHHSAYGVVIVGGGVAGLSAGTFTARHGLNTLIIDAGESLLRRNAHLENYPGFPAGINARLLLEMMQEQADNGGCDRQQTEVTVVETTSEGFAVETAGGDRYHTEYVIAATKNTTDYLAGIEDIGIIDRGKTYVDTDERGRTGVEGLYAAGRLAEKPHQAIVNAGHGAEVAVTLLEDDDRPFYHDWVAPDGYFTDRGRDLPPGCEEIDDRERRRREDESRETIREYVAEPHPDEQRTHPSLREE